MRLAGQGGNDDKVSVRLPPGLIASVRRQARQQRTTVSAIVRSALEDHEKTQRLAAKLEQVVEALQHIAVGPLAVPEGEAQIDPGAPAKSGAQETGMTAGVDVQPMDEETLRKRVQAMLAAFGGDDE